jgi:hypothetical protein
MSAPPKLQAPPPVAGQKGCGPCVPVGKIVLFHAAPGESRHHGPEPWPAIVTKVHADGGINLTVFTPDGTTLGKCGVRVAKDCVECPDEEWCSDDCCQEAKTANA